MQAEMDSIVVQRGSFRPSAISSKGQKYPGKKNIQSKVCKVKSGQSGQNLQRILSCVPHIQNDIKHIGQHIWLGVKSIPQIRGRI